jgi:MarR family transcriptional regulator, transcriptional regulator for hemolysin
MAQTEEPWRPQTMPAQLIARAARLLGRIADARLRELGVSVSQLPVIVLLKNGERRSQKALAQLTGVEQPSMAQLLARMERDGLVRREPDPADGRSSLISLTAHAMTLLAPGRLVLQKGNREALAGFKKNEIDLFVSMLRRVIANMSDGEAC